MADFSQKVFIGGLSLVTDENSLKETFTRFGNVVDSVIMRDPTTNRSRGFGFITFDNAHSVDQVMNNRPYIIDGKKVDAKRAVPRVGNNDSFSSMPKIFVGGLREGDTEDLIKDYFSKYGRIVDVNIKTNPVTGAPRGFAFVTFDENCPVDKSLLLETHFINNHKVDLRKALNKYELTHVNGGKLDNPYTSSSNNSFKDAWSTPTMPINNSVPSYIGTGYSNQIMNHQQPMMNSYQQTTINPYAATAQNYGSVDPNSQMMMYNMMQNYSPIGMQSNPGYNNSFMSSGPIKHDKFGVRYNPLAPK